MPDSSPIGADAPHGQVYCTLVLTDSYLPGAAVLAHSLRDSGSTKKLAVLYTPETVSATAVESLKNLYDYAIPVDRTSNPAPANLTVLGRPDLLYTFTKIELWNLSQFSKIVYLDADTVVVQNIDNLFEISAPFAASPDIGWPDAFNSGVMVLKPSQQTYQDLHAMASRGDSFDGADQGLLNQYFENRGWHRLSFTYNCTPNAEYQWEPAYRHYKDNIKVVHFIGKYKPWNMTNVTGGTGTYRELLGKWFSVRDRHPGSWYSTVPSSSGTAMARSPTGYTYSAWNPSLSAPPTESQPEAANFPTQLSYTLDQHEDVSGPALTKLALSTAFQPPKSYPPPPANLGYDLPPTKVASPESVPAPIFPWEEPSQSVEKVQTVPEPVAPAPAQPEPAQPTSDSLPAAASPEPQPSTESATVDSRGRRRSRDYDSKVTPESKSRPLSRKSVDKPATLPAAGLSFRPDLNAWDADPVIRQYMHSLMSRHETNHYRTTSAGSNGSAQAFLPSYPSFKHVSSVRTIPDMKKTNTMQQNTDTANVDDVDSVTGLDGLQAEDLDTEQANEEAQADIADLPLRSYEETDTRPSSSYSSKYRSRSLVSSVADSIDNMTVVGEDKKHQDVQTGVISCPNCGFHGRQPSVPPIGDHE